jgi:hypothetical protein
MEPKNYGAWTGLGLFLTLAWQFIGCFGAYGMSNDMSENENELWLGYWA